MAKVRAADPKALVAAVARKAESLRGTSFGKPVLVVYGAKHAWVYSEAVRPTLASRPAPAKVAGRSPRWPTNEVRS